MLTVTKDMVMPTAITGSYPRPLWYDVSLRGQSFKTAMGDSLFREQYLDAVAAVINAYGIGALIQYTQLFIPAYLVGTPEAGTYNISSIEIKKNSGGFAAANIQLNWDEEAVCDPNTNVTVTIT